ncbi:MAG TPA: hypothetical protein VH186_29825 [Chloroflexia bacterium]|nr:hypothetical protein [Chloroflexia bacterium]
MNEKPLRMARLQFQANIATGIFSAIAIALAFAHLNLAAQLTMIPVTLCLIASVVIAYRRYQYNKQRREEILSQLDAERDRELIELFDGVRKQRNLPPDAKSADGYSATVKEVNKQAAEASKASMPPGIKRRGGK